MNLKIKTILAAIFVLLFSASVSGQTPRIDSLEMELKIHTHLDTARVNLLNILAYEIRLSNPLKAKLYAKESLDLSTRLNYPKGRAASLWLTGIAVLHSDKELGLNYYRQALKIAEEIGDKEGQCSYLIAIGNAKKLLGDTKASDENYEKALKIAHELKNKKLIVKAQINSAKNTMRSGDHIKTIEQLQEVVKLSSEIGYTEVLSRAYANLGLVYNIRGNYPLSMEYYLLSLKLNEKRSDYIGMYDNFTCIADIQSGQNDFDAALETIKNAQQLAAERQDSMRVSLCLSYLGNMYRRINDPEALEYFQRSLLMSKFNTLSQDVNNLVNIGSIYTERKEFDKALISLNKALIFAQNSGVKRRFGEVYIEMGVLYLAQRKYGQARENTQKALTCAEETNSTELQKDCSKLLSEIHAATGNFKDAYIHHIQYKLLYDSISNEKNTRKIALLESSYEFNKEREVYDLEKSSRELKIKNQQQIIFSLVVISLLVISLSFAIYWSARMRKKVLHLEIESINKELEANQKTMAVAKLKLVQNSERDAHNVKILEDIGKKAVGEESNSLNSLINNYKLQAHMSNWEEFETLFTKVNTSFWDKLNERYPTLTPNERKLCVFMKLNMSNKDIMLITFQSEEALKKSRLRLRRKFDLDRSVNLVAFIQNL